MFLRLIRFGTTWHVVVGEGFGFDISYEVPSYENRHVSVFLDIKAILQFYATCIDHFQIGKLFYMFHAGSLGVCAWRCS